MPDSHFYGVELQTPTDLRVARIRSASAPRFPRTSPAIVRRRSLVPGYDDSRHPHSPFGFTQLPFSSPTDAGTKDKGCRRCGRHFIYQLTIATSTCLEFPKHNPSGIVCTSSRTSVALNQPSMLHRSRCCRSSAFRLACTAQAFHSSTSATRPAQLTSQPHCLQAPGLPGGQFCLPPHALSTSCQQHPQEPPCLPSSTAPPFPPATVELTSPASSVTPVMNSSQVKPGSSHLLTSPPRAFTSYLIYASTLHQRRPAGTASQLRCSYVGSPASSSRLPTYRKR